MAMAWNTTAKNPMANFSSFFIIAKYPEEIFGLISDVCNGRVAFPEKFKKPTGITHFLSLQGKLTDSERKSLLEQVRGCEITTAQMKEMAINLKLEHAVKESFCELVFKIGMKL